MTAGLPRSSYGAIASTPLPVAPSCRIAAVRRRPGLSMMDERVRGSYDITNAKFGFRRIGACRSPGIGGA
jgi:hypothetical protein